MDVLEERGFIKQTVYGDDLRKKLETESVTFTSDSTRRRTVCI